MYRKKVVLADDVELFLKLEKTFFNREEFQLITARNGRDALNSIRDMEPDLVFMDLYMPEMNGDECCRTVKDDAKYRQIPIIMVTAGGREEDLERCRAAGCDAIVHKPINRHDFMATARRFLQVQDRQTRRFSARLCVRYGNPADDLFSDYSVDLSAGGLFLATAHPLPLDTLLSLEFALPGKDAAIRCKARVAWVNESEQRKKTALPEGMGVQFMDLSLIDMEAIGDYLKSEILEPDR